MIRERNKLLSDLDKQNDREMRNFVINTERQGKQAYLKIHLEDG